MTGTTVKRSAFTRRLSADAWQHLMAGHLADYARENGRWVFRRAGDVTPYADDEAGLSDREFGEMLASLEPHGCPVVVPSTTMGKIERGEGGRWQLTARKVNVYPELAGGGETAVPTVKAAAKVAPVREITSAPSKAATVHDDELAAYVDRLVYVPKRDYAAAVVAAVRVGRNVAEVDRGGLSEEVAAKVLAKVARIVGTLAEVA